MLSAITRSAAKKLRNVSKNNNIRAITTSIQVNSEDVGEQEESTGGEEETAKPTYKHIYTEPTKEFIAKEAVEAFSKNYKHTNGERLHRFLADKKGVHISPVKTPHVFKIKVSSTKQDRINYNKACEFVDVFCDRLFDPSKPALSRSLYEFQKNEKLKEILHGGKIPKTFAPSDDDKKNEDAIFVNETNELLEDETMKEFFLQHLKRDEEEDVDMGEDSDRIDPKSPLSYNLNLSDYITDKYDDLNEGFQLPSTPTTPFNDSLEDCQFFHEMTRAKGGLPLHSTRSTSAGMNGMPENRFTINRSPFVHNLSKEAFGFVPRIFFDRREVYSHPFSYDEMQDVVDMITELVTTPIMAIYPSVAVECTLEADAYFQYEGNCYRERIQIGPWGNNIPRPKEYDVERFEEDDAKFVKEMPTGIKGLPSGVKLKEGTYLKEELDLLMQTFEELVPKNGSSKEKEEACAQLPEKLVGTVLEGRTVGSLVRKFNQYHNKLIKEEYSLSEKEMNLVLETFLSFKSGTNNSKEDEISFMDIVEFNTQENWESVKPKLSGTVLEERSIDAMRNAMEEYFHGKEEDKLISSGFYGD